MQVPTRVCRSGTKVAKADRKKSRSSMPSPIVDNRVAFVDVAKGLCILLVVMMHATLGVEKATGETTILSGFIEWAKPFRMPDFFLISGLFLASRINRPWQSYLDSKVVYFAYFYVLWLTIQFALKAPGMIAGHGLEATAWAWVSGLVQPWGTLWFIYMLALFFVVAKLLEAAPKALVWVAAAALYTAQPHTGSLIIDEFAARFVFFYTGYWAAPFIFQFASRVAQSPVAVVAGALAAWAAINWLLVAEGLAFMAGLSLWISYAGVAAVIALSVLLAPTSPGGALAYLGRNSIKVYLAFPLFMGPARVVALKLEAFIPDWGAALISTAAGVAGALVLAHVVQGTRFGFLFARPSSWKLMATGPGSTRARPQVVGPDRHPGGVAAGAAGGAASTTRFKLARPVS